MSSDELMGRAGIVAYGNKLIVHGNHGLVSGAHLNLDDAVCVTPHDFTVVGRAVKDALGRYKRNMPMPVWSEIKGRHEKSVAKTAGVRSYSMMMKGGAKTISVTLRGGVFTLHPWKREGLSFVGLGVDGALDIAIPDTATDEELGAAVITVLERAQ